MSARTNAHEAVQSFAAGAHWCSGQFSAPNVSSRPDDFANRKHKTLHAKREYGVKHTAPKTDALGTPETIKEICEYIYTEPHLIEMCENMYTAPTTDALVTPEAIKEMCEYIYTEPHLMEMCEDMYTKPHLISVAKAALEAHSQRASKKQRCFSPPPSLLGCQEECVSVRTRAGEAGAAGYASCLRRCAKNYHSSGIVVEADGVQRLSQDEREGESLAEIIEEEAERVRVKDLIEHLVPEDWRRAWEVTLAHIEKNVEDTHALCSPMSDVLADKEGMEDEEERDKMEQEREQKQELGRQRATDTLEAMSQRSPQEDRAIQEATGVLRSAPNAFTLTHSTPGPPALEGYTCGVSGDICETVCGDGLRVGSESCDDGNSADGDGCSSTCEVEAEWICSMASSDINGRLLREDGPSTCARTVVLTMSHRYPPPHMTCMYPPPLHMTCMYPHPHGYYVAQESARRSIDQGAPRGGRGS